MRWLVLLCLLPMSASAYEIGYQTHWWPAEGETLPPIPIIGFSGHPQDLKELEPLTGIWLVSGAHKVPLRLMTKNTGVRVEQRVWTAHEPLQVGKRYALEYALGGRVVRPMRGGGRREASRRMSWIVESNAGTPRWLWPPEPVGRGGTGCSSCGCTVSQRVRIETQSARTLEVTVNNHKWIQPISRTSTIVDIGYGVVGGPNRLRSREFNTIEFAILDGAERYPAPEKVTSFIHPWQQPVWPVKGELSGIHESSWSLLALFGVLGLTVLKRGGARSRAA
jgi:hypothetical protein